MEALQHSIFFSTTIPIILNHYDKREVNELQYLSLGLLRRLEHGSISLQILLKEFDKNPQVDFSAGLIIRALYLDMLISLNLYKLFKDNHKNKTSVDEAEANVNFFCKTFLADGLDLTAKYLKQMVDFRFKTEKELIEVFNTFAKNYSGYFEPHCGDGSMPKSIYPRAGGASSLFNKLASDNEMKGISGIYDSYLYYSKYDHFGILYFDTHLSPQSEKIRMLNKAMRMFTRHCAILYEALDRATQNDAIVTNEFKKVSLYMTEAIKNDI